MKYSCPSAVYLGIIPVSTSRLKSSRVLDTWVVPIVPETASMYSLPLPNRISSTVGRVAVLALVNVAVDTWRPTQSAPILTASPPAPEREKASTNEYSISSACWLSPPSMVRVRMVFRDVVGKV